ncbi:MULTISPECIES: hypothetical protein [unclassified Ruminococcus]|uniref:hypothetical protein n=1 Tax=unclassified Ruminococcus TaxID=2608920 RepID=UPI00210CDBD7|nr:MULTISPECIES: hypothetical protein [unclassified Ruminococcus]MCQ4021930.1 hypothetical protein [Ruminococcus sp. zg-924]MCQ4115666.1 hypothetical protein [Ruminococcus sp. zg-921]
MFRLSDLKINSYATVGGNLFLVDVVPSFVYTGGKRTDEVDGFKYIVAMPAHALEKIAVKIAGNTPLIELNGSDYPVVVFDGLELSLYWTPSGYQVSAKANAVHIADKDT